MIHNLALFQLGADVDEARLEELQRATRTYLLKIPGVVAVRAGRNVDLEGMWDFFYAIEVESLEKLRICRQDPMFLKFEETLLKPLSINRLELDFEMDPSKDLKYS